MKINKKSSSKKKVVTTLIIASVFVVAAGLYFTYAYTTKNVWPFNQSSTQDDSLPKIQTSEQKNQDSISPDNQSTFPDDSTSLTPTKTEGKTPSQYEGEGTDSTSEYNNEQFRIPEGAQ
jgi:cytoskeletal protein RodZ